jgi:uncharacterized protein (DUF58 family)
VTGEFHYRLRRAATGQRPGSHAASTLGAGHRFAGHARLFDIPDPRRIDLRASLRDVGREWLVRTYQQRAAIPVYAVVDVSASMSFGARLPKLARVADFVEAMGNSAFRAGDPAGLIGFGTAGSGTAGSGTAGSGAAAAAGIDMPARHSRGVGSLLGARLRERAEPGRGGAARVGLAEATQRLAGREALVFLVSDFHWPLELLGPVLDVLNRARVVPMVAWDRAEIEPPATSGLLRVTDAESGATRTLWVGRKLRERWLEQVARRRDALEACFLARDMRPFYLIDRFDSVALSRHFMDEAV